MESILQYTRRFNRPYETMGCFCVSRRGQGRRYSDRKLTLLADQGRITFSIFFSKSWDRFLCKLEVLYFISSILPLSLWVGDLNRVTGHQRYIQTQHRRCSMFSSGYSWTSLMLKNTLAKLTQNQRYLVFNAGALVTNDLDQAAVSELIRRALNTTDMSRNFIKLHRFQVTNQGTKARITSLVRVCKVPQYRIDVSISHGQRAIGTCELC
jgi:hypothetical protein